MTKMTAMTTSNHGTFRQKSPRKVAEITAIIARNLDNFFKKLRQ
jgi:hypothetical protein